MQREAVVQAGWYSPGSPDETHVRLLQNHKDRRIAFEFELARELVKFEHARELKLARERQNQ
jgi:hypothetical protein